MKTKALSAFLLSLTPVWLTGVNQIHRETDFWVLDMNVARYEREIPDPLDLVNIMSEEAVNETVEDTKYDDKKNVDLASFLPKLKSKDPLKQLAEYNKDVNELFSYVTAPFNYWHTQSPSESLLLGAGDCKAYAAYKYHLLKQLGYTNVRIVTVVLPDGRGGLAGHALVVVNDLWVMDINPPYFYPFERLRESTGLMKAFDSTGVYNLE